MFNSYGQSSNSSSAANKSIRAYNRSFLSFMISYNWLFSCIPAKEPPKNEYYSFKNSTNGLFFLKWLTKIHNKQEKVWRGIKIQTPELSVKESEGESKGSECVTSFMIHLTDQLKMLWSHFQATNYFERKKYAKETIKTRWMKCYFFLLV